MKSIKILIITAIVLLANGCSEKSPIQGLLQEEVTIIDLNQSFNMPTQVGQSSTNIIEFTLNNEPIKMSLALGRNTPDQSLVYGVFYNIPNFDFVSYNNTVTIQGTDLNDNIAAMTLDLDTDLNPNTYLFAYYFNSTNFQSQNNINFSKTNYFVFKKLNTETNTFTYGWISFLLSPNKITFYKVGYTNNSNLLVGVE